jgi:hypothetical protein
MAFPDAWDHGHSYWLHVRRTRDRVMAKEKPGEHVPKTKREIRHATKWEEKKAKTEEQVKAAEKKASGGR